MPLFEVSFDYSDTRKVIINAENEEDARQRIINNKYDHNDAARICTNAKIHVVDCINESTDYIVWAVIDNKHVYQVKTEKLPIAINLCKFVLHDNSKALRCIVTHDNVTVHTEKRD